MNKIITIYELLGMMKDGKAPKKIRYNNINLYYDNENDDYFKYHGDYLFRQLFYMNLTTDFLNYPVEILEEQKKIPEKLDMVLLGQCDNWLQPTIETDEKIRAELNPYVIDIIRENTLEIQHKFNELLDYLKSKGDE